MEALGLLGLMRDANVAGDAAVLRRAVLWCDANGAESLGDIMGSGLVDDFVAALQLKPIPLQKLRAALQALQPMQQAMPVPLQQAMPVPLQQAVMPTTMEPVVMGVVLDA